MGDPAPPWSGSYRSTTHASKRAPLKAGALLQLLNRRRASMSFFVELAENFADLLFDDKSAAPAEAAFLQSEDGQKMHHIMHCWGQEAYVPPDMRLAILDNFRNNYRERTNQPEPKLSRSYSNLLAAEAGLPIETMRQALSQESRELSAKPQVLSAAQRIWSSRSGVSATPAAAEQPAFERTYSWECSDEIGVPIGVVQEVLTQHGRDTAKPRVLSMAQKIWTSRNLKARTESISAFVARVKQAFARVDENGDGDLSRSEMITALQTDSELQELLKLPSHTVKAMQQWDTDKLDEVFQSMEFSNRRRTANAERTINFKEFKLFCLTLRERSNEI